MMDYYFIHRDGKWFKLATLDGKVIEADRDLLKRVDAQMRILSGRKR